MTQRSARSWTSWSLSRKIRRLKRVTLRLRLMQVQQDSLLLLQKELEQQVQQRQHRLQEMAASSQWHLQGHLSP